MIIYLAGVVGNKEVESCLDKMGVPQLFSYYYEQAYIKTRDQGQKETNTKRNKGGKKTKVFLDSGAFSAWSRSVNIDIYQYIDFIKEYQHKLTSYSVLDSIGDPKQTLKNQKIMEKAGLSPLPCYHYGEDEKYLRQYIEKYEYISFGGMVPVSTPNLKIWLDRMFQDYICDEEGIPKIKVHGFGMTSFPLMFRFPWYSVDSTAWLRSSRSGKIYIPKTKNGVYNYRAAPIGLFISHKNPNKKIAGQHIDNITPGQKKIVMDYVKEKGAVIGESKFHQKNRQTYVLQDNEKWFDKESDIVETIVERGLINHYVPRDLLNADFFMKVQNEITKNKKPFLMNKKRFF